MSETVSFPDYLACTAISFEWATSYDTKDWTRLAKILAPTLSIDYSGVMGPSAVFPSLASDKFVSMMSAPDKLGHPLVKTQHLLGTSTWVVTSPTEIEGTFQLRAAHVRFDEKEGEKGVRGEKVRATAHGHALITHFYTKEEGVWKLKGLRPQVLWNEGSIPDVFKD